MLPCRRELVSHLPNVSHYYLVIAVVLRCVLMMCRIVMKSSRQPFMAFTEIAQTCKKTCAVL